MTKPATILGAILMLTALPAGAAPEVHVGDVNVAANPFGPFFSYYDGAVSLAVSQNVAISVSAASFEREPQYDVHSGMTMKQIVASSPIYLREPFSGPFVEPGIIYRAGTRSTDSSPHMVVGSSRWIGVELLAGWQWRFESGLNLALAFGVALHAADLGDTNYGLTYDTDLKGSWDEPDINGYFRVGYDFSL